MEIFVAVIVGLMLGSFLSVLLDRWEHKKGIVAGRSHCPKCLHTLAWYDLVPLLSWLWLRGSCRYCLVRISPLYPVLELAMGAALGLYVWRYGVPNLWMLSEMVVLFALVCLFFFDLRYRLLPDVFTYGLSALVVARLIGLRPDLLVNSLATGALLAAVLFILYAATRGQGIGFGDVKLAFGIGVLFGFPGALGVTLAAIWAGALVGVFLMVSGRATMKTALPFGSFWTGAAILTVLWPDPLFWLAGLVLPFALP